MSSVSDEELFAVLKQMRSLYPGMRFGQLVCNLATWARGSQAGAVWDVEDQELLTTARKHVESKQED